jgi:hypothetical protein
MGTVTIRNYNFPIRFSYKGWNVEITNNTGFFSMKDLKVRVRMVVDSDGISNNIAHALARAIKIKEKQNSFIGMYGMQSIQEDPEVYQREYCRINKLVNEFAKRKGTVDYTLSTNGGMLDRFFGQNISAVENMCQKVVENIDRNYGDVQGEFLKTL